MALARRSTDTFFDKVRKFKDVRPCDEPMALPKGHKKKDDFEKYPTVKSPPSSIQGGAMK
jgi:hypothetical protein